MVFEPKESTRTGNYTFFAEVFTCEGPPSIAAVSGSLGDLFGTTWLLVFDRNKKLKLYKWTTDWTQQSLPISLTLDGSERRFSMAFDQSAQLVLCYEKAGTILLHYVSVGDYTTRTFAGTNPTLFMDALASKNLGDSDVICLYQKPDEAKLYSRLQRERYGAEREIAVTPTSLTGKPVLDRVAHGNLRWQALLTDQGGVPLNEMPSSPLFPYISALPVLSGSGNFSAYLDELAHVYSATLPTLQGDGNFSAFLNESVRKYIATLNVLQGNGNFSGTLATIGRPYSATLPTLQGDGNFSALLDNIATVYGAAILPTLQGNGNFSAVLS